MTTHTLKPTFQDWLRPLVKRMAGWGVTANQVTIAAPVGSLLLCAALMLAWPLQWPFLFLPVWFFLGSRSTPWTACWRASTARSRSSARC